MTPGADHRNLHNQEYYQGVVERLQNARDRAHAIHVLDKIRRDLTNVNFPGAKPLPQRK